MAKAKRKLLPALFEDDFGLTTALARKYLNPEGDAPTSRLQVQLWTQSARDTLATVAEVKLSAEGTQGRLLHAAGTQLRYVRGHSGWKELGREDVDGWETYCERVLGVSRRNADRLVMFAGAVSEQEAGFGVRKCIAGLDLLELLGLERLGQLAIAADRQEPPEWEKKLGEPVAFTTSSAARLERLVRSFEPAKSKEVKRDVADLVERRAVAIEQVQKRHPALLALRVRSFADDGQAWIDHRRASTDEEIEALVALYQALRKVH